MNVDDLFDLVSYRIHPEAHIRVNEAVCAGCTHRACTFACPAHCYEFDKERDRSTSPTRRAWSAAPACSSATEMRWTGTIRTEGMVFAFGPPSRSRSRARRTSGDEVLVLLEVGADVRIPPDLDPRSGRVREDWLVASSTARASALWSSPSRCSRAAGVEVTAVHLGPARLSLGCDRRCPRGRPRRARLVRGTGRRRAAPGKALVLAAAAQAAGFDIVLAGAAGVRTPRPARGASRRTPGRALRDAGRRGRSRRKRDRSRSSAASTVASASASPRRRPS